jgi:hypothetical protein
MVLGVPLEHEWLVPKLLLGDPLDAKLRLANNVMDSIFLLAANEVPQPKLGQKDSVPKQELGNEN